MDAADVVDLIAALAWPVVLLVALLLFRGPLALMISRLRSIEGAGVKGVFAETADEINREVDALPDSPAKSLGIPGASPAPDDSAHDAATRALIKQTVSQPWWAVHQAWKMVRASAKAATAGRAAEFEDTPARVRHLRAEGLITDDFRRLTETLRALYDDMKEHPEQITPDASADFVEAASKLSLTLDQVAGHASGPGHGRKEN